MRSAVALRALPLWALPVLSFPTLALAGHAPAEGYGAATQGGTGQPQCVVTSLADTVSAGTLRSCVADGNTDVKFSVSGTIELTSTLSIKSFTTIDGLSAPSPGITITGAGMHLNPAQHVIIRGVRMRNAGETSRDCILLFGQQTHHVVIEHNSLSQCGDGALDISAGPKDITIQWNIFSDNIAHLWGSTDNLPQDTDRISYHHNLHVCGGLAVCDRMPLIRAKGFAVQVDYRHNVVQGALRANGMNIEAGALVNVVGNAFIPRPETSASDRNNVIRGAGHYYTAENVELGATPRPNLNDSGNEPTPFPGPPITAYGVGCAVAKAGVHPRDAEDTRLLTYVTEVPAVECR
jgi:pectate lyase